MLRSNMMHNGWSLQMWRKRYWSAHQFIAQTNSQLQQHGEQVARLTGKGIFRQGIEILRAAVGYGKLTAEEYYRYQMYQRNSEEWTQFVGFAREERIRRALDMERWYVVVNDKLLLSTLLTQLDLRTPKLFAIYHPLKKSWSSQSSPFKG